MLRKNLVVILVFVILFIITSCGATQAETTPIGEDIQALDVYADVWQKLSVGPGQAGAFDVDFVMVTDTSFSGETMSMTASGNMALEAQDNRVRLLMFMDMGELGTSEIYFDMGLDGDEISSLLMLIDGEEIPGEFFDMQDLMGVIGTINVPDLDTSGFISSEIIFEADGNTIIDLVFDGQNLVEFALGEMAELYGILGMNMEFFIEDMPVRIVLDENNIPQSMTMHMTMTVEYEGEAIHTTNNTTYVFNAFGGDVVIAAPGN